VQDIDVRESLRKQRAQFGISDVVTLVENRSSIPVGVGL
jgi:hypothetical protein